MQVTISVLPVSLNLIHVPRSRLTSLSHPIIRQILHPDPAFLNITCNEVELSIFTDDQIPNDFEPIARRDRHRFRSRSGSGSSAKSLSRNATFEPVEVSYEKWSVLQIDSHSDQQDSSGSRIHELSAPLAAAGISILYQSSYMSDFIFVKESRLKEVIQLFNLAGFDLYMGDSTMFETPSPTTSDRASTKFTSSNPHSKATVFTRANSPLASSHLSSFADKNGANGSTPGRQSPRTKSHSPTSSEVRLLEPDLACVGLSDEFDIDHWGLKIVKLVAFPDLISQSSRSRSDASASNRRPSEDFISNSLLMSPRFDPSDSSSSCSSEEDNGYFSHSPRSLSETTLATMASRSCSNLHTSQHNPHHKSPSRHAVANLTPLSPPCSKSTQGQSRQHQSTPKPGSNVPFFSFTRTPEGSSLTADVHLLATLFPPHERHMVICGGELDAADSRLPYNGVADDEEEDDGPGGTLMCLQIDLRRFGLDKHGLVNRFSRVLQGHGINHMYSSTFKTANLLVDKKDALRAHSLLRAC